MCYPTWSSSLSGRQEGGVGGIGIYTKKLCGIYTVPPNRHLYNNTLAFIQQHTGIYTTTHWHLYNNTLAFIQQHTGIYTTTHIYTLKVGGAFMQIEN